MHHQLDGSECLGYRRIVNALACDGDHAVIAGGGPIAILFDVRANTQKKFEHFEGVTCAAFSPDGIHFATGSEDMGVRVFTRDGALVHLLKGHLHEVRAIAFSPSGELASAGEDGTVHVWNAKGEAVGSCVIREELRTIAFVGGRIIVGTRTSVLRLRRGDEHYEISKRAKLGADVMSASPNGKMIAALGGETLNVIDADSFKVIWSGDAQTFAFVDDTLIAFGDHDRLIARDLVENVERFSSDVHEAKVRAMAVANGIIAAVGDDLRVSMHDAAGRHLGDVAVESTPRFIAYCNHQIVCATIAGVLEVFSSHAPKKRAPTKKREPLFRVKVGDEACDAAMSPDGTRVAVAVKGGIDIRSANTGAREKFLPCDDEPTWGVKWTQHAIFARLQSSTTWRLWDPETLDPAATLPGTYFDLVAEDDLVLVGDNDAAAAFRIARGKAPRVIFHLDSSADISLTSPKRDLVLMGTRDEPPVLIELRNGSQRGSLGDAPANHGAFSPDGAHVAITTNNRVALFSVSDLSKVAEFPLEDSAWRLQWSPRGDRIAVATSDNVAHILDAKLALVKTPTDDKSQFAEPMFSPRGDLLALGVMHRGSPILVTSDGEMVARLKGHGVAFVSPEFVGADRLLTRPTVSPSNDLTLRLWDHAGKLIAPLAGLRGKSLWMHVVAPDASRVVVIGDDDPVPRVFSLRDGTPWGVLNGHDGTVRDVHFCADGSRVATIDDTSVLQVWALDD